MSEESGVGFTDAGAAAALSKLGLSHEAAWKDVEARIKRKFNYSLQLWCQGGYAKTETQGDGDSVSPQWRLRRTHRVPLSRRFCQKAGLQLFAKEYDYESNSPFLPIDVAGVVPVVKFSMPKRLLRDAADLLDVGRLRLSAGQLQVAYDMVHEALLLLYEVFGGAGTESAQCCSTLSMIVFNAGDYESAVALQRRACVLLERLQGTCHADTVHAHAALSAYLAQYGDTEGAIRHMLRALYLMDLIAGPHHPDSISWYMKLGIIYQEAGYITKAIECFRSALRRPNYDLTQASACLHAIASCHAMLGKFKDAIQHEKKVYTMLKEKLG
ncbi:FMT, partial [Symbiodinium sp. KB8]